jgi:AbrB family looped-hinge helix DNA binding protein
MDDVATITSKKMITLPARIRKKYGLREGRKVRFVEIDGGLFLVPILSLKELDGVAGKDSRALVQGVRELEREHRAEAKRGGWPCSSWQLAFTCLARFRRVSEHAAAAMK